MQALAAALATALADTFAFYLKAHVFHWNVVGPSFPQYHALFRELYADAHGAADDLAEKIRTLGVLAPASPCALLEPANVDLDGEVSEARDMIGDLLAANRVVASTLEAALKCAEACDQQGIANFLQGRIEQHGKWDWMLSATLESDLGPSRVRLLYSHPRSMALP